MFSQFSSGHTNPPVTCFYPSDTPDLLPRYRKYPFRNPPQSFSEYPQSFLHNCYISTILMYHYTVSPVFSQEFEKKNPPKLLFTGRHFWNRKCRKKTIAADYERDICDTEAANRAYQTDRNR